MRLKKLSIAAIVLCVLGTGIFIAADHTDAPAVSGSIDITDFYAFQSPADNNNLVFACNVNSLLAPSATAAAVFDPNSMIEFNIDNDGDNVEDLVIQCLFQDGKMWVYGPVAPASTGTSSTIMSEGSLVTTDITEYGGELKTATENGVTVFAGPRDDPFFFDFNQFVAILGGTATSFNSPGDDTFAGTNVLSVVVEVPKSMLGGTGTLNTWAESKRTS